MSFKQNKKYSRIIAGFTLTELMITITVFVLLSAVVITNFRSVDNSLILTNVAHQVAVIIRKAQISGISNTGLGSGAAEVFPSYGVHFDTTGPPPQNTFILFADLPAGAGDGVCLGTCPLLPPPPPGKEGIQRYTLAPGYTIKDLCGNFKTTGTPGCGLNRLNITFVRPNPDAVLKRNAGDTPYSNAEVIIQSKTGVTKTIVIWKTGQISIE